MSVRTQNYNPYNGVTGLVIDRFQGVYDDGLGANIPESTVDYAENADDRWRGAVRKRKGYQRKLEKAYGFSAFGKIFDGMYWQANTDIHYRTELLLDWLWRPSLNGPRTMSIPSTPSPYVGVGAISEGSGSGATFSGGYIGSESGYSTPPATSWRYSHIAKAIDERRDMLGLPASGLPTTTKDQLITYANINSARAFIESHFVNFVLNAVSETTGISTFADYNDMLTKGGVGGIDPATGLREWKNYNLLGVIAYRNDMISSDLITTSYFRRYCMEMEKILEDCLTYEEGVVGLPTVRQYLGTPDVDPMVSWNSLADTGNSTNFWFNKIIGPYILDASKYQAYLARPAANPCDFTITGTAGVGYQRTHSLYVKSTVQSILPTLTQYTSTFISTLENNKHIKIGEKTSLANPETISVAFSVSAPPYVALPGAGTYYQQICSGEASSDIYSHTQWVFPEDADLGSWEQ